MMKNAAPLKKFQFLDIIEGDSRSSQKDQEIQSQVKYTLSDVEPFAMKTLNNFIFLGGKISSHSHKEKDVIPSDGKEMLLRVYKSKIINEFTLFSKSFKAFEIRASGDNYWLISIGIDNQQQKKEQSTPNQPEEKTKIFIPPDPPSEVSALKIFDISSMVDPSRNDEQPIKLKTINLMKRKDINNYYNGNDVNDSLTEVNNITCFDVSKDLTTAAIGCSNGDVIIIKADENLVESPNSTIKVFSINHNVKDKITNIGFSVYNHKNFVTYSTKGQIYYYEVDENNLTPKKMEFNGGIDCDCMSIQPLTNTFIMSSSNDGYLTEFQNFENGLTIAFDGKKRFLQYFKNYYAFVVVDDSSYSFSVYDIKNKIFIYHTMNYYNTLGMCTDDETIFVLVEFEGTRKKTIFRYKEKDNKDKFEIFYKKSFFETAYSYAKNLGYDKKKISEISKKHAEHLYKKGEYEKAIDQYILTINYLDPSYVIQKFLEGTKLDFLIKYLETLNKDKEMQRNCKKEEMKDYTALLLNCYIKQKKIEKLKEFVDQKDVGKQILETAIEVCKDTKETKLALEIAEKSNMIEAKIQILMDLENKYEESLKVVENEMTKLQQFHMFMQYGSKFFEKEKNKAMKVLQPLVEDIIKLKNGESLKEIPQDEQDELKKITYEQIISIFISNEKEKELEYLLDLIMTKDLNCPPLIIHRLIELYLEKIKQNNDFQKGDKIKEIITSEKYQDKIDKNYLLMLFKIYKFTNGTTELSKKMKLNQELLQLYMDNHNYDKIIEICKETEVDKVNYWIQALNYFINISSEGSKSFLEQYIKRILNEVSHNESFSPLLILAILKKSKNIQLETVKDVLIEFLSKTQKTYREDKEESESNKEKIKKLLQEQKELHEKAKTFAALKCSLCNKTLSMPFVYFMCNHAYHSYCHNGEDIEDMECTLCKSKSNQIEQRLLQSQEVAKDHNSFQTELKGQSKKFNLVGKFMGKGIFEPIKK